MLMNARHLKDTSIMGHDDVDDECFRNLQRRVLQKNMYTYMCDVTSINKNVDLLTA